MKNRKKSKGFPFETRQRFSIRKFNVGVVSVAIAAFMIMGTDVSASELEAATASAVQVGEQKEPAEEEPQAVDTKVAETTTTTPTAETPEQLVATEEKPVEAEKDAAVKEETASTEEMKKETSTEAKSETKPTATDSSNTTSSSKVEARKVEIPYTVTYVNQATQQVIASEEKVAEVVTSDSKAVTTIQVNPKELPAGYQLAKGEELKLTQQIAELQQNQLLFALVPTTTSTDSSSRRRRVLRSTPTDAELYTPTGRPREVFLHHDMGYQVDRSVTTDHLPKATRDATKYAFKQKPDSSMPGLKEVTVIITYPDNSVDEVKTTITVILVDPEKTLVADPANLTEIEKREVIEAIKSKPQNQNIHPESQFSVSNDGTVTVTNKDGSTYVMDKSKTVTSNPTLRDGYNITLTDQGPLSGRPSTDPGFLEMESGAWVYRYDIDNLSSISFSEIRRRLVATPKNGQGRTIQGTDFDTFAKNANGRFLDPATNKVTEVLQVRRSPANSNFVEGGQLSPVGSSTNQGKTVQKFKYADSGSRTELDSNPALLYVDGIRYTSVYHKTPIANNDNWDFRNDTPEAREILPVYIVGVDVTKPVVDAAATKAAIKLPTATTIIPVANYETEVGSKLTPQNVTATDNLHTTAQLKQKSATGLGYEQRDRTQFRLKDSTGKLLTQEEAIAAVKANADKQQTFEILTYVIDDSNNQSDSVSLGSVTLATWAKIKEPVAKEQEARMSQKGADVSAEAAISNRGEMPEGTTYAWESPLEIPQDSTADITKNVVVTYNDGSKDIVPVTIKVKDDVAPTVEDLSDSTVAKGAAFNQSLSVGDNVAVTTVAVTGLPAGVTYNGDTANPQISGTPTAEKGDYPVTVTVRDAAGNETTKTFTIHVTDKDLLQEQVDDKSSDSQDPNYTEATPDKKEAYDKALADAEAVLKKPDASQDEIDAAQKALEDAKSALDGQSNVNNAKDTAKQDIDKAAEAKKSEIDARQDLTDEEKTAAKAQVDTEAGTAKAAVDAATTNDAVESAKNKGVETVKAINPDAEAKNAAEKAINDAAKAKIEEIKAKEGLTEEEKEAAIAQVAEASKKAVDEIVKATTNDAVEKAKNDGLNNIDAINPDAVAKPEAKKAIDEAAKAKKAEIDARKDLTDEEKTAAKAQVDAEATKAKDAVDAATTNAGVEEAKTAGETAIKAVPETPVAKPEAKKAIDEAAKAKKEAIDANDNLTAEEKAAAKEQVDAEAEKAKDAVDAATTNAGVEEAKTAGETAIKAVPETPVAKPEAKKAIDEAAKAKKEAIDANDNLTAEEKAAAKEQVDAEAEKAKDAVDAATTNAGVEEAKTAGETAIKAVPETAVAKPKAKDAIDEAAKAKKEAIDANDSLTDEEKAAAKEKVDAEATKAKDAVDAATTNAGVEEAKTAGETAIKAVPETAVAKPKAKDAIDEAAKAKKEAIDANDSLTDEEKVAAKEQVDAEVAKAKDAVDAATTNAGVEEAKTAGETAIKAVPETPVAKPEAKKAIDEAAKAKKEAIDANDSLTDEEKAAAKEQVDAEAAKAKDAVDAATTNAGVEEAKTAGETAIKAVPETPVAKPEAKKAIDEAAKAKKEAIDANDSLTDEEKAAAKEQVDAEAAKA
ncbi:DUF1542 domain-containing protein, partial [Streptococcus sp. 10F2]